MNDGRQLGNVLGWVCYAAEDHKEVKGYDLGYKDCEASMAWDHQQSRQLCKQLDLKFKKVKLHLAWAAGYAKGIDSGNSLFCYGAVNRLDEHDLKHAKLHVIRERSVG